MNSRFYIAGKDLPTGVYILKLETLNNIVNLIINKIRY